MKTSVIEQKDIAAARDSLKATRRWVGQELSMKLQIFHHWKQKTDNFIVSILSSLFTFDYPSSHSDFFPFW